MWTNLMEFIENVLKTNAALAMAEETGRFRVGKARECQGDKTRVRFLATALKGYYVKHMVSPNTRLLFCGRQLSFKGMGSLI
ncbi:unnamed protein product [Cuscuta campestris]|uniref:Uncharacterized protein n=1 Tax=Cuscuta campestris TaxID=132261 RepID=A0A484MJN3_9ASTE|nr:unnamed protein product [Cuscuta campestris]